MMNKIKAIQNSLILTNEWISDLMTVYDFADEEKAFVLLRAVLKTLRDRVSTDEALHLGSNLPAIIRGFYYEGWSPHNPQKKDRNVESFLASVRQHLGGHEDIDLEMAVPEAMKLIFSRIGGEAKDVKEALPAEIQDFIS